MNEALKLMNKKNEELFTDEKFKDSINNVLDLRLELYKYSCNDTISVKIMRKNEIKILSCTLCDR